MVSFHWYGLFIGIGIVAGFAFSEKIQKDLLRWHSAYAVDLEQLLPWVFIPAVLGARLYHVIDYWEYYRNHLVATLYVWEGGVGIFGAVAGGVVGLTLFKLLKEPSQPLLPVLDLFAFGTPLVQAIGRLGNFFNQELFGKPTTLPWGIEIRVSRRPLEYEMASHFHPLFAYEAVLLLTLAIGLFLLKKPQRRYGFYFFSYLLGYGFIRFALDFLRIQPWSAGWLSVAQVISLVCVGIGVLGVRKTRQEL